MLTSISIVIATDIIIDMISISLFIIILFLFLPLSLPFIQVVVDDICMCVSEVVRGGDLLKSTARQLLMYRALIGGGNDGGGRGSEGERGGGERGGGGEEYRKERMKDEKEGEEGIEREGMTNEQGNLECGKLNNALPSSTFSTSNLPSSHPLPTSSPSLSSSSSSTHSSVHNSIPFIIPSFYHCDLVRDYNTHKRISKRNQESNNDDNGVKEDKKINSTNMICENIKENKELLLSSSIHDENINENEDENNSNKMIALNQSIQISSSTTTTTTTTSISLNNKMDTSSEMFTLRYLREIGYTPDRIRGEILDLNSDFIY
jgi:hypothetical protein